jgi:hypothetical protein
MARLPWHGRSTWLEWHILTRYNPVNAHGRSEDSIRCGGPVAEIDSRHIGSQQQPRAQCLNRRARTPCRSPGSSGLALTHSGYDTAANQQQADNQVRRLDVLRAITNKGNGNHAPHKQELEPPGKQTS